MTSGRPTFTPMKPDSGQEPEGQPDGRGTTTAGTARPEHRTTAATARRPNHDNSSPTARNRQAQTVTARHAAEIRAWFRRGRFSEPDTENRTT